MAGTRVKRREKMSPEMLHIFVVIQVFHHISSCVGSVESSGQAFIQTDNELRFMGDVPIHLMPGQNIEDMSIQDEQLSSKSFIFDPPLLDFKEQPLGMPHMERVIIHNAHAKNRLHLLSISGSTLHFHCSFFQDKYVPPGGNTTFEVVFLARQVGNVENTLYIHTSQGSYKYQVFGVGVANPYRVRPFLGARVPVNSSFSPLIHMHNPHGSTLQVEEIYTSGGDLHLELPTGETEATKDFWAIPPYETKPIMKASFIGRIENNHTSFIRIKTNKDKKDQVLILPVEVEVTSAPGLFSSLELLDFGLVRTFDDPKVLQLNLLNSGSVPIHISDIVVDPPNSAIDVDFRPIQLKPDILQPTTVASISYTATESSPSAASGRIIVRWKLAGASSSSSASRLSQQQQRRELAVPYQASVLHGSLQYDHNHTMFYTGHQQIWNITRDIPLTNAFPAPLVIYNATVPTSMGVFFTIKPLKKAIKLQPQMSAKVVSLEFHPNATHLHFVTVLSLQTNASTIHIPFHVYNGKLKVVHHRPEIFKGQLDFGTLGVGEARSMTFTLRNDNPLPVLLREYNCNMKQCNLTLLGVERGNGTMLRTPHSNSSAPLVGAGAEGGGEGEEKGEDDTAGGGEEEVEDSHNSKTQPLVIDPNHFAVFSVNLEAPSNEGTFAAEVVIATQFDYLYIPMTLRTAEGSLVSKPPKLAYEKCFPGKVSVQELHVHSSFIHFMAVRDVTFSPNDTRFYYVPPQNTDGVLIEPDKDNIIGSIHFDMRRECGYDCYVGLATHIPAGHHWLMGAMLQRDVADTDQYLYTRLANKWHQLHFKQQKTINVTIQLDTNQVRGFLFPAQAHLTWPDLVSPKRVQFPLTQIGNISISEVVVENPAHIPVMMQILPLSLYPNPQTILDMVANTLDADLNDIIETDTMEVFTLQDLEQYQSNPNNRVPGLRNQIENTLGVRPHPDTVAMLVNSGSKIRITLGFVPVDDQPRTSLILIRNNLTIIDTVLVQGQGGRGEMRFNNKKAGSSTPLQFDFTDKHLKSCDSKKSRQSKNMSPSFTVRKTFTAKNTGQLPFYVQGFSINGIECEGFGFKVIDCTGFELMPDESRKVDIAFTPDFTMSRIRRVLVIHTSLGSHINYTLQATLPPYMLTKCAAALPRPDWEGYLFYGSISLMAIVAMCVVIFAYIEADRVYSADIMKLRMLQFDRSKVFDLARMSASSGSGLSNGTKDTGLNSPVGNGHAHAVAASVLTSKPTIVLKPESLAPICNGNGHVVHSADTTKATGKAAAKKKESFLISSFKLLYQRFVGSRKSAPRKTRPSTPERQISTEEDSSFTKTPPEHDTEHDETPPVVSKTSQPQLYNPRQKKAKGTKRQLLPVAEATSNSMHKKAGRKSSTEKTDKNSNTLNVEGLEPSLSAVKAELDQAQNIEDSVDPIPVSKGKGRKGVVRQQRGQKGGAGGGGSSERAPQHKALLGTAEMDRDDTSSTTTESSLENEKTSSARDSTPEPPQPPKKQRVKNKSMMGNRKSVAPSTDGAEVEEEEFMVTSKSKAHKKIRVDPKTAYGGNILSPSTYELPYTLKKQEAAAEAAAAARAAVPSLPTPTSAPDTSSGGLTAITLKNNPKGAAGAGAGAAKRVTKASKKWESTPVSSSSSSSEVSTAEHSPTALPATPALTPAAHSALAPPHTGGNFHPAPLWDSVPTVPTPGEDLSELSVQTELFARVVLQPPPQPPPAASSVMSSVSSSLLLQSATDPMSAPPPPLSTPPQVSGSGLLLSKAPGTSTSRSATHTPSPPPPPTSISTPPLSWNPMIPPPLSAPLSASSSMSPRSSFGLDSISLGGGAVGVSSSAAMDPAPGGAAAGGSMAPGSMAPASMAPASMAPGYGGGSSSSIMQILQVERRMRNEEYHKKVSREDYEWPGFSSPMHPAPGPPSPLAETMWNPHLRDHPEESWSTPTPTSNLMWSPTQWTQPSSGSIWGSSEQSSSPHDPTPSPPVVVSTPGNTYDPFSSNIWNPATLFSSAAPMPPPRPDDDMPGPPQPPQPGPGGKEG